jgi:hypothetical protein
MINAKQLAVKECANHNHSLNGINDYCISMDNRCILATGEKAHCNYFEKSVLPLEPDLARLQQAERKAEVSGYEMTQEHKKRILELSKHKTTCDRCGTVFNMGSNRHKYCTSCEKSIRREQTKARVQKSRRLSNALENIKINSATPR